MDKKWNDPMFASACLLGLIIDLNMSLLRAVVVGPLPLSGVFGMVGTVWGWCLWAFFACFLIGFLIFL